MRIDPLPHRCFSLGAALLGLWTALAASCGGLQAAEEAPHAEAAPSFRLDVMPVFFRAGCNSGGCHGSARGKDGFRLSLFGFDPAGDYFRLTQQMVGRRVNVAAPEESLLLQKATGQTPHTGGALFKVDSPYYRTLKAWVEAGAPDDSTGTREVVGIELEPSSVVFAGAGKSQPLVVFARYSDGSKRDATKLARFFSNNKTVADVDDDGVIRAGRRGDTFVFARFARFTLGAEAIVLPEEAGWKQPNLPAANYIDAAVYSLLEKLHIAPTALCDDEEFLRRAHLDLIGLPPTTAEYRAFMGDRAPDKRAKLVDALLQREEFADLWTAKWSEALKLMGVGYTRHGCDEKAAEAYYDWIREQVARNAPLDEFVRTQITASGSNLVDGPANFYTMLPQNERVIPKDLAQDVAQLFTGVRIQCAECHNHPFDRWTMDDYYGFVSFFTGISRKRGAEPREFFVYDDPKAAPARHLLDVRPVPARVLGGLQAVPAGADRREALAKWLTAPDNEFFARNLSNRIWAHFLGRGVVEPVDDLRISNPPCNKELLDALTSKLVAYRFDAKKLIRDVCTSHAYQRSASPGPAGAGDERQFARASLRRIRADVLLDAISQATESPTGFSNFPRGGRAVQFYPRQGSPGATAGHHFLDAFGRSKRGTVCACETRNEPTLSQTLHLINGETIQRKLDGSPVVPRLLAAKTPPAAIVEELYIRVLGRRPQAEESEAFLALVGDKANDRKPYDDLFWALLNSSEFLFNH